MLIDGLTSANDLGLTNAVPSQINILTDCRLRSIKIDNLVINFKVGLHRDPEAKEQQQPIYITNNYRSIKKNIFVVIGICTHLGCVPIYKPKIGEIDISWVGGFFCPCHGSKFDLAGRVYKGVPAPLNLVIPPHKYINDKILRIGED